MNEEGGGWEEGMDGVGAGRVLRQRFVMYTGWASLLDTGTVWVRYNDGTQLGLALHHNGHTASTDRQAGVTQPASSLRHSHIIYVNQGSKSQR